MNKMFEKQLFDLGFVGFTRGVKEIYSSEFLLHLLKRHAEGDWGDLPLEDVSENQRQLMLGGRIFSAYRIGDDDYIFIITYPGQHTIVMMADEY